MISTWWIYSLMLCLVSSCLALEHSSPDCIPQIPSGIVEIPQPTTPQKSDVEAVLIQVQPTTSIVTNVGTTTVYSTVLPETSDQVIVKKESTPLYQQILAPVVFIYRIIHSIVSRIFRIVAFFISPLVKTASLLLHMFVFRPLSLMQYLVTALYPVFFFLTMAMVTGICFGAVGGWFSEVILSILSKSKKPSKKSPEFSRSRDPNLDKFQMQYSLDSEMEDDWYEDEDIE
ncbi:hypothetical protein K7432_007430 [Basidiobolus ranarum]|uniref:Uncharacterized protein n=1 Tax=Basidiobolus ranarum TaxID=34480 RepID=A0ABR2WTL4_9FUNG